jgi:hypothetical protein
MDKVRLLVELLAVAAVSTAAMASKPAAMPPDSGVPQLSRSGVDGGMAMPRETKLATRSSGDGGY